MTRSDFEELFDHFTSHNTGKQKKLDISSALTVYYGLSADGYRRLAFLSASHPPKMESTRILRVVQGKEHDGVFWTCFDLLSDNAKDVYYAFCSNLVLSVEGLNSESQALSALKTRYSIWKTMFKAESAPSVPADILRGLYGELYFIKRYLLSKYGEEKTVLGWSGPDRASKDFSMDCDWYEVKTVGVTSPTVTISSIAQLSSDVPGYLAVIKAEQMSGEYSADDSSIIDLIDSIVKQIDDTELESTFIEKISSYGTSVTEAFSKVRFSVHSVKVYGVVPGFPKITTDEVPYTGITNVSYEIAIAALEPFLEEQL